MARWIGYVFAGAILLILITTDPARGYRANPKLVTRYKREAEVSKPIELTADDKSSLGSSSDSNSTSINKETKPVLRNRGKVKFHNTQVAPKPAEKETNNKRALLNEKTVDRSFVRSRQARNVSETTVIDEVTEPSVLVKPEPTSVVELNKTDSAELKETVLINPDPTKIVFTNSDNVELDQKSDAEIQDTTLSSTQGKESEEIPSFDISKYISEDFRNKVYQVDSGEESTSMSLQVHDPVEAVKGIRAVNSFRFEDELTTPRTPLFDERHSEIREQIQANIAQANGVKVDDDAKIDLTELAEKAKTDNKTSVDVLTIRELHNTDAVVDGHIKKEFVSGNETQIAYETSNLETNRDDEDSQESTETTLEIQKANITEAPSSLVTTKTILNNTTTFVNNLDVKVREVFPDLSTPTTKIDAHTPTIVMTVPVVDSSTNTSHPRLRISVKTNKVDYRNDTDTTEKVSERSSTREQKSYFASTPDTIVDGKSSNEIQQAQESARGTTKVFRQFDFSSNPETATKFDMNLPDNADVWSLVGLKHVPMQKRNGSSYTTELPSNIKQLADWSEIMKNEANSTEVPVNVMTTTQRIIPNYATESQGEENKLIPIQVPAPTKAPTLVVDSNLPSNDITTVKPEEVIHKEVTHTTPVQVTNDYRDTLQFNRVDDFDASPSPSSSPVNKTRRIPVILRRPKTTTTTTPIPFTFFPPSTTYTPHTTSNILEILGPKTPNIIGMTSDDFTQTDSTKLMNTEVTTEAIEAETTQVTEENDSSETVTEVSSIEDEIQTTEISETPTSTELMYNDSPSFSTMIPQEDTTVYTEEPTTIEAEETTIEEISSTTLEATYMESTTEDSTTLNEPPIEVSTQSMDDLVPVTDSSISNRSSLPILESPTTDKINSETNKESTNASSILSVTTLVAPRSNSSPAPDTSEFEDDDEYSDHVDVVDVNLNNNISNGSNAEEGTTKTMTTIKFVENTPTVPSVIFGEDNDVKESPAVTMENIKPTTTQPSITDVPPFTGVREFSPETTPGVGAPDLTTDDPNGLGSREPPEDSGAIAAVTISAVGVIALIILVALLYVMRKRQHKRSYGQRCTPVSLDAYSVDSVSVYSSVRGKNRARASKRSYGNPAYNDSGMTSHSMSFPALSNFVSDEAAVFTEFTEIPTVTVRADEVPPGCEVKNRYANVMPLPETRVPLTAKPGDELGGYINANYVRGQKGIRNYYIACQAPMQSTVNDFWRMIWEQQTKVILMITDLYENGVEKCADYLPPSEVLDCHRLFGDYKVTLKKREVKDKYVISSVQLCNMESGTWREITHLWYMWPEKGVPKEFHSMIAFLIEARSFMKSPHDKIENNNTPRKTNETSTPNKPKENESVPQKTYRKTNRAPNEPGEASNSASNTNSTASPGQPNGTKTTKLSTINEKSPQANGNSSVSASVAPVVVHCSPGTGRTGAVIACDLAIRDFEMNRTVDLPKTVYRVRRDRANAVQTKEQYMFVYQVINLYATKLTGGVLDSI